MVKPRGVENGFHKLLLVERVGGEWVIIINIQRTLKASSEVSLGLHWDDRLVKNSMGKSSRSKAAGEEELAEPPENDRVFVPHYWDYANTTQGSCTRAIQNAKKLYTRVPQDSPPSVLPPTGSHQFWPSSGDGSSISSVDNVMFKPYTLPKCTCQPPCKVPYICSRVHTGHCNVCFS